jgi:hypothetical protein
MSFVTAQRDSAGASSGFAPLPVVRDEQTQLPRRLDPRRLGRIDIFLICLFLAGIYTNFTIQISAKVPFPSMPAGIAGLCLLWRRRGDITQSAIVGFIAVEALYVASILCATDLWFLARRTNGLLQLTYSLVIGYALFLTVSRANRRQVAGLFLGCTLFILTGCLLETYAGFAAISDPVRALLYSKGIYANDLRDIALYGKVRPKFFASEPASVTFCYSLFAFVWLVVSQYRHKLLLYVALVALGIVAMPGPTLLLMLVLVLPYLLFLASRRNGRFNAVRFLKLAGVAAVFSVAFVVVGQMAFSRRLDTAESGHDPSFFYRVRGPALAGLYFMEHYPFAGAGLTGEPFAEPEIVNVYSRSSGFSTGWQIVSPATELVINYFWLHWIYLGAVGGLVMMIALSGWLRLLHVPSVAFCWTTWAVLGQASGAYVGPTCWAVFFLSAAAAVLHQRAEAAPVADVSRQSVRLSALGMRLHSIGRPVGWQPTGTPLFARAGALRELDAARRRHQV